MTCHCQKCGHEWTSKIKGGQVPLSCPACKSYKWDQKENRYVKTSAS